MLRSAIASLLTAIVLLSGCAHYQVGSGSLYAPDVQTVFVPTIESESFRRDLGERLTEAIVKEIELKTPYKVVGSPNADAVLQVKLRGDTRATLIEDSFDVPRTLENQLVAEISFVNRRRFPAVAGDPMAIPIPSEIATAGQSSLMVPVVGQSVASSQDQAISRLAQQIVGIMEAPW